TWSSVNNQPTAQFYHVATDDQFPYRIYGAQQDNSTVSIPSRSDDGAITLRDWYSVGGGESGYIAPQPGDPGTVFAGTYMGTLTRYDHRTRQARDVSVWLNNYDGYAAADGLIHSSRDAGATWDDVPPKGLGRFTRVSLLEPSHFDAAVAYLAANRYQQDDVEPYLFKTADYGKTWTKIVTGISAGTYTRAVREDPVRRGLLFAGTATGLHVTFDAGCR